METYIESVTIERAQPPQKYNKQIGGNAFKAVLRAPNRRNGGNVEPVLEVYLQDRRGADGRDSGGIFFLGRSQRNGSGISPRYPNGTGEMLGLFDYNFIPIDGKIARKSDLETVTVSAGSYKARVFERDSYDAQNRKTHETWWIHSVDRYVLRYLKTGGIPFERELVSMERP